MEITLKLLLGFCFGFLSAASLLLNIIALFTVFRLAFVLRKNNVYIIAFFNILSDVLQMTMATFYLAPSIVTSSFLISTVKKSTWTMVFGSSFMFLWYFETITQVVMALNRYVIICQQKHKIFTFTTTILLFTFLIPFCFVLMYNSQYLNPCCSFVFDQEYLSYSYYPIEGIPNYSDKFDLPLNASSSIISAICYIMIFWTVHNSTPTFSSVAGEHQKAKRNRDIRYAIQFSLLLVFYVFVWVLFRVLPILLANRHVEWFILVPTFYTINCTSNAIIYLGFNSEVQNNIFPEKLFSVLHFIGLAKKETPKFSMSMISVTNQSRTSVGPVAHVAIRFIPERKHQPFRSIGMVHENQQHMT
ncbi:hypothetical protein CRE_14885 [Caenorhabditis remanei]|uniref:G-protein coupled receptors family 1 profile domain-containing protein n=1 Tax=Caenorhabditis remanei TaxID=31234 RepID=E3N1X0_CAERE|nr:hypothetical protein CRE_14885 [Caenorhabditis remanei]